MQLHPVGGEQSTLARTYISLRTFRNAHPLETLGSLPSDDLFFSLAFLSIHLLSRFNYPLPWIGV